MASARFARPGRTTLTRGRRGARRIDRRGAGGSGAPRGADAGRPVRVYAAASGEMVTGEPYDGAGPGDVRLSGGGGPAPGPDDQFAVQQQGDLPARADLERVGRHRPVAAGVAGPGREPGGGGAAADPCVLRPGR